MRYVILFLLVTACHATVFNDVLPMFAEYPPDQQARMAKEFDELAADSALRPALRDC
jgi:hypothetical protein